MKPEELGQKKAEAKTDMMLPDMFPDRKTCRVKHSFLEGEFECLGFWSKKCPYLMSFGESRFCRHPAAALIFEWRD
jgi:hypothetical protein